MAYELPPGSDNVVAAAAVLCALSLKFYAIGGFALVVDRYIRDPLASWLSAWIAVQVATILAMLTVSTSSGLTTTFAWTWLIGIAGASTVTRSLGGYGTPKVPRIDAPSLVFLALLAVMALRSFLMFDYTLDGFAYGYPRMAIWMNYGNMLVQMNTAQINIFSNEWNGELNGLIYGLSSGNIQGFGFGNVEVMALLFLSAKWFSTLLCKNVLQCSSIALIIFSSPAVLGLASTTKGDLLAVVGIILAAGFTLKAVRAKEPYFFIAMAVSCAGLAVGSKLASAPISIFALAALILTLAKPLRLRPTIGALCVGIAFAAVFCSRFFLNLFAYGNALARADGESPEFGIYTFVGNLGLVVRRLWSGAETPPFDVWALSAGFGTATLFIAVIIGLNWRDIQKRTAPANLVILVLSLAALTTCAALIPYRPWSFRYLLPAVVIIAIALATLSTKRSARLAASLSILGALINFGSAARPGEIIPPVAAIKLERHFTSFANAKSIERAMMFHPGTYLTYHVNELCLDKPQGISIATLNSINTFYFPFLGSHAQNRLLLTADLDELVATAAQAKPDLVSVTRGAAEVEANADLSRIGYVEYYRNDFDRVRTTLFIKRASNRFCPLDSGDP
ncbi:hypothetical protein AAIH46_09660 [Rhizobium sp. 0TCS1.26]|uniref:hypothetical protein n=1 Tax=Rhizobium sp. 0TCS1.26 TaxID=3142623 RepID=UPI003D27711B